MKNRIPQGWMIPQYRTLKSKLPKYRLKESSIPQYRKLNPMPPSVREKWVEVWDTGNLKTALYHTLAFRAFSLTWPASMLIYGTKESFYIRKEFNPHRIGLEHQHDRRFIVLEHRDVSENALSSENSRL